MSRRVLVCYVYGVDFKNADDELIADREFESEAERDDFLALPDDEFFAGLPEGDYRVYQYCRPIYRPAVYGVDYGRGSVKRRFGGGHVPKGAYQF